MQEKLAGSNQTRWIGLRRDAVNFCAYGLIRTLVAILGVMPLDMGDSICRGLARLLSGPIPLRGKLIAENLERVFPTASPLQKRELTRRMWHSLLLTACEVAWADRRLHRCNWSQHVQLRDNGLMLRKMLSGRPVVMVTGHFGNFEIGGYVTGLMGFQTLAIARKLDNRFLDAWVQRFRSAKGQFLVDKQGCAPVVDRHLSRGGILSILADQHAGDKGCWVPFMGIPASCHKALALFSLGASAPMVVAATCRLDGRPLQFEISSAGAVDPLEYPDHPALAGVADLTRWYNDRLAAAVSRSVEQYWWLHRRWRSPPARVAKRLSHQAAKRSREPAAGNSGGSGGGPGSQDSGSQESGSQDPESGSRHRAA
ncbi:MAG: lysophospholipid acyltransferase family protein [Planctomycetota bacterium]